MNYIGVCY